MRIAVGDVVTLPSAPNFMMTVLTVAPDFVTVGYFNNSGQFEKAEVPPAALRREGKPREEVH